MKNLMYTIGITAFLACGIFNVTATLNNPFFGMSHIALAQGSGGSGSGGGVGEGSCEIAPPNFYCHSGGAGALSCEITSSLGPIYSVGCRVTCEGNGCYACCDSRKERCICVRINN